MPGSTSDIKGVDPLRNTKLIQTVIKARLYAVNKIWLGHISTFVSSHFMPFLASLGNRSYKIPFRYCPTLLALGTCFLYLKYISLLRHFCGIKIGTCVQTLWYLDTYEKLFSFFPVIYYKRWDLNDESLQRIS